MPNFTRRYLLGARGLVQTSAEKKNGESQDRARNIHTETPLTGNRRTVCGSYNGIAKGRKDERFCAVSDTRPGPFSYRDFGDAASATWEKVSANLLLALLFCMELPPAILRLRACARHVEGK